MTFMEKAFTGLMTSIFIFGLISFFSTKKTQELEVTALAMIVIFFLYAFGRAIKEIS